MTSPLIIKHITLNYNSNLCNCLKNFFVNNSNTLLKQLLSLPKLSYTECICLKNFLPDNNNNNFVYLVWTKLSPLAQNEMKSILLHSNAVRYDAKLDNSLLNFNYTQDIRDYIIKLTNENIQYYYEKKDKKDLYESYKKYYKKYYQLFFDNYQKLSLNVTTEHQFFEFINPIFVYNYMNWDLQCEIQKDINIFFVPDITNVSSHVIQFNDWLINDYHLKS